MQTKTDSCPVLRLHLPLLVADALPGLSLEAMIDIDLSHQFRLALVRKPIVCAGVLLHDFCGLLEVVEDLRAAHAVRLLEDAWDELLPIGVCPPLLLFCSCGFWLGE